MSVREQSSLLDSKPALEQPRRPRRYVFQQDLLLPILNEAVERRLLLIFLHCRPGILHSPVTIAEQVERITTGVFEEEPVICQLLRLKNSWDRVPSSSFCQGSLVRLHDGWAIEAVQRHSVVASKTSSSAVGHDDTLGVIDDQTVMMAALRSIVVLRAYRPRSVPGLFHALRSSTTTTA